MIKFFIIFYVLSFSALAGELDGKGLICKVYGDTVGYFFDLDRAYEYKLSGGKDGLEIKKKDVGKYLTNENSIFINEIKINRKDLSFQKYSSFRGECKAFKNMKEFKKGFDIEELVKDNKI
ncbi:MAG: hypothetical protein ACJ0G4_00580 [Alphaproteobacteria bacterium]|tara:strand:+ start:169 stop:531 length:363 start_codon:yes stop_codon:yes gene_type:complete